MSKNGFQLRPYQHVLIDGARGNMAKGVKRVLIVAPTGAGKTALAAWMLDTSARRGKVCWFNVHRRELVRQSAKTMDKVGVPHGIISAGFREDKKQRVQIVGVQTVRGRLEVVTKPDLIVWDECHHIASASWTAIFDAYPDAYHVGLTATPCRLDGRGLGDWFDVIVEGPTTRWLIENGFLCKYKLYAPFSPDMKGAKKRGGDFTATDAASKMDKPAITGDAISHYRKLAHNKSAIVFASNIKHSQNIVSQFREAGYTAEHLDGTMDSRHRDRVLAAFERGEIKIVSNVDLFGEGFDVPAIEAVILMRPTASTGLYLQQVGRALRTSEGKEYALILDHAGNALRHGLPDEVRAWSLDDRPKKEKGKKDEEELMIRQCPACYSVHEPSPICPECGHEYETKVREIEQREGELVEVDIIAVRATKKREQSDAKTLGDLIALATERGYKNPSAWANHIWRARQSRRQN